MPLRRSYLAVAVTLALGRALAQEFDSQTLADPEPHLSSLYFVANAELVIDGNSESPLDRLGDQDLAWTMPHTSFATRKVQSEHSRRVLLGDTEPVFTWYFDWEDIDALAIRRYAIAADEPVFDDFVLSVEDAFGGASEGIGHNGDGALDGALFRVTRDAFGARELDFFLTEKWIAIALGHNELFDPGGFDVDAFAQDSWGNVFLSFRTDVNVRGTIVGDAAVVCIPRLAITYDGYGDIVKIAPSSATIVFDDADADAMVQSAALHKANGQPITNLGDLQALTLDPLGGTFPAFEPITGYGPNAPNFLFAGQSIGASILSTRSGGSRGIVNGVPLAHNTIHGGALGLDIDHTTSTTHDLNALTVTSAGTPQVCLDASDDEVMLGAEEMSLHGAGFHANELVVLLLDLEPGNISQSSLTSTSAPTWARYRHLFVTGPLAALVIADSRGRVTWTSPAFTLTNVEIATWARAQLWGLTSGRLSPPVAVWCATP